MKSTFGGDALCCALDYNNVTKLYLATFQSVFQELAIIHGTSVNMQH